MTKIKIVNLKSTGLFEELSDADLTVVVGGKPGYPPATFRCDPREKRCFGLDDYYASAGIKRE